MHFRNIKVANAPLLLTLCCTAAAQTTYVYVGNYSSNTISGYSLNRVTGFLTPVSGSPFSAGANPIFLSLDRQCRFIYAPNVVSNNVSSYVINNNTGNLAEMPGSPYAVGVNPNYSGIDQLGKFLYVPNQGPGGSGNTISAFTINGDTGLLSPVPGSPFSTGGVATAETTVDPSNRFLFVANASSNDVSGFTIDRSTGVLNPIIGSPWTTGGSSPRILKTDGTGRFLYVSNRTSITIFAIDQNTGALSQVSGSPVSFGSDLYAIAIDASNKFAYIGDNRGGLYGFSINSESGLLTALPGFPIQTDSPQGNPVVAADPSLGFLYVTTFEGSNTVGVWRIDPNSGGLTKIPGSLVPTGNNPGSIATCTADADGALARLIGGNTFTGNQTVNGTLAATSFTGNGASLTGVNAVSLGGIGAGSYARLDIGNSFSGNQSIAGTLTATALSGSGSGLTNLNPANLAGGTAGINISGTAATASTASNALNLGSVAAANYARLDISNTFAANQTIAGTTTIGTGGTPIVEHLSATVNPSFPALKPAACATTALTLSGAADGDTLALGVSNARMTGGSGVILNYSAWVSATDTISIQACNFGSSPQKAAGSGAIRVDLWKH